MELKGNRLAGPIFSFSRILFPAFAQRAGFSLQSLRWKNIPSQDGIVVLLDGKADAVVASQTSRWRYKWAAKRKNLNVVSFSYISEGVDM